MKNDDDKRVSYSKLEKAKLYASVLGMTGGVVDIDGNIKRDSSMDVTLAPMPQLYKYKKKIYCENCYSFSWNANPRRAHEGTCVSCGRTFTKKGEVEQIPLTAEEQFLVTEARKTGGPVCDQMADSIEEGAKKRHEKNKRIHRRMKRNRR